MTEQQKDAVPDSNDRAGFEIPKKRTLSKKVLRKYQIAGVGGGLALIGLIGILWFAIYEINSGGHDKVDSSKVKSDATLDNRAAQDGGMTAKMKQVAEAKKQQAAQHAPTAPPNTAPTNTPPANTSTGNTDHHAPSNSGAASAASEKHVQTPQERRLMSGVLAVVEDASAGSALGSGDAAGGGRGASASDANEDDIRRLANSDPHALAAQFIAQQKGQGAGLAGGAGSPQDSGGAFSNLQGSTFAPSSAYLMPPRKYLLEHNTYTRCVLYTEIITDQPGLIECRLTQPLYSADGSIILAEAGDRLTGEQHVSVKPGQARVFTAWTELETTTGVRVKLNSLGAGAMGASGTAAWIDNHYAQRFGGAVMLSFIQDALQSAANATSNSQYSVNNSESNAEDMASKALDNTINIPPTAYILPGTVINVIVARDIDFSPVFATRK